MLRRALALSFAVLAPQPLTFDVYAPLGIVMSPFPVCGQQPR